MGAVLKTNPHVVGAVALLLTSAGLAWVGQPGPAERWQFLSAELEPRLTERQVQIDPAELLGLMHNDYIDLRLIDVRSERDWNLFHLWGAEHIRTGALVTQHARFALLPSNAVIVLMSNDEAQATEAWKLLMATASRPNAYILAGGINRWLAEYADGEHGPELKRAATSQPDDTLRYAFKWALGSRHPAAMPDEHELTDADRVVKKVRLQKRTVRKGGCG
jgi:rhodanese-related sulfurtransferase